MLTVAPPENWHFQNLKRYTITPTIYTVQRRKQIFFYFWLFIILNNADNIRENKLADDFTLAFFENNIDDAS